MIPKPLSAKGAAIRIGGVILIGSEWDVTPRSVLLPANHFDGGGFEMDVHGLRSCRIRLAGWWNPYANIHDPPLLIGDATILLNVRLYVNGVGSPFWNFPEVNLEEVPMTARVEDRILYTATGKSNGVFIYPTGNAA